MVKRCPGCHSPVEALDGFCQHCGFAIEANASKVAEQRLNGALSEAQQELTEVHLELQRLRSRAGLDAPQSPGRGSVRHNTLRVDAEGHLLLGHYAQDNSSEAQAPIRWQILHRKNRLALVISCTGLACRPFMDSLETKKDVSWSQSSLRNWLNNVFYEQAFSVSERSMLVAYDVPNQKHTLFFMGKAPSTRDHLFLLSKAEVLEYFPNESSRMLEPTEQALQQGAWVCAIEGQSPSGKGCWWLRSPGEKAQEVACVGSYGRICSYDCTGLGLLVRPAMWIKL